MKLLIFLFFNLFALFCTAQKNVKFEYAGGHGCVDNSLFLYTDSTYEFTSSTAFLFSHTSTKKGYYLMNDTSITLYYKKKMALLIPKSRKYHYDTFRIRNNNILMYSVQDELSKDSSFIKAYQTMHFLEEETSSN
jgi:hypothetical protein